MASITRTCSWRGCCHEDARAGGVSGPARGPGPRTAPRVDLRTAASSSSGSGTTIHLEDVTFSYVPGAPTLRNASLSVGPGTLHFLLGLNGCGKSTLLKTINGMVVPQKGSVSFEIIPSTRNTKSVTREGREGQHEEDLHRQGEELEAAGGIGNIGYVFQNPDDQVCMPTVYSDVALALGKYKGLRASDAEVLVKNSLDRVGMLEYAERQSLSLSGGQKQRVAIAGALVENPSVLLLDELTTFLDGKDQMNVLRTVRNIVRDSGITAVWVTHRLEELDYADSVSYMEGGRIVWTVDDSHEAKRRMKRMGAYL
jgi:energy-coupling factor transport system ATP-binding protein